MKPIASHLSILLAGLALGLGAVAVAQQPAARSATDLQVVSQLRTLNTSVKQTNSKLDDLQRELNGFPGSPIGGSIVQVLRSICRATPGASC